jgi:hypothetical protein
LATLEKHDSRIRSRFSERVTMKAPAPDDLYQLHDEKIVARFYSYLTDGKPGKALAWRRCPAGPQRRQGARRLSRTQERSLSIPEQDPKGQRAHANRAVNRAAALTDRAVQLETSGLRAAPKVPTHAQFAEIHQNSATPVADIVQRGPSATSS